MGENGMKILSIKHKVLKIKKLRIDHTLNQSTHKLLLN